MSITFFVDADPVSQVTGFNCSWMFKLICVSAVQGVRPHRRHVDGWYHSSRVSTLFNCLSRCRKHVGYVHCSCIALAQKESLSMQGRSTCVVDWENNAWVFSISNIWQFRLYRQVGKFVFSKKKKSTYALLKVLFVNNARILLFCFV